MSDPAMSILVTGASSGIGELSAKTLARAGYRVYAGFRNVETSRRDVAEAYRALADEENIHLRVVEIDVRDEVSVRRAIEHVIADAGELDVVVNNAGIASRGPIEAFTMDQIFAVYDTNVFGPLRVNQAVLPHMRERRFGLIVQISSTLGRVLPRSGGLYPASKWGIEGLAESQHYELKPFGVELVILEPGSFPTPAVGRALQAEHTDVVEAYREFATPPRPLPYGPNPPDPQIVADDLLALIQRPHGTRGLRVVSGPLFTTGVDEYNAEYERMRDHLRATLERQWGPD